MIGRMNRIVLPVTALILLTLPFLGTAEHPAATVLGVGFLAFAMLRDMADRPGGALRRFLSRLSWSNAPKRQTAPTRLAMEWDVSQALHPDRAVGPNDAPPDKDETIAGVLRSALEAKGARAPADLPLGPLTSLWTLDRLLRADAPRAGDLAQYFRKPDLMLDLRDHVLQAERARADHLRGVAAFNASSQLWQTAGAARPGSLRAGIARLQAPDPDLWHHIVAGHDPSDPAQREAALYCLHQPSCERATVALFLYQMAETDALLDAARRGDSAWLASVRSVIERWNRAGYGPDTIGLEPPNRVEHAGPLLAHKLDTLAFITGGKRWADPAGVFVEHRGRPARPRAHWCLTTGRLLRAPRRADFIAPPDRALAAPAAAQ